MPLRLLYNRENRGQVGQGELSTRVKSSTQVPASCVRESRLQGSAVVLLQACLRLHGFVSSSLTGEIRNEPQEKKKKTSVAEVISECSSLIIVSTAALLRKLHLQ